MDGNLVVFMQIVSGALIGVALFLLKDIKEDLKIHSANVLEHLADSSIHCNPEKFKFLHTAERG